MSRFIDLMLINENTGVYWTLILTEFRRKCRLN